MGRAARIAVVGAGWWSSTVHLPSLSLNPAAEVVAVCDPDPARADAAASAFGIPASYDSLDRMLRDVRPDGIVVATPHSTHYGIVRTALRSGTAVLVEKPMATSGAEAWELVDLAEQTGALLMVGLTYQFSPTALVVQRAVQEQIGDLRSVNAEFSSGTLDLFAAGMARDDPDDPARPHGSTYADPATGGGQAHTQLSHLLGAVTWATGMQATSVAALMETHGLDVDLVDALSFRLDNGALAVASSTGTTPAGVPARHVLRFHGTEGMVEWDLLRADAWIHLAGGRIRHAENSESRPSYPKEQVSATFVDVLLDGAPNPAPAADAAAAVALIEAAYASAATGRTCTVLRH